MNRAPRHPRLDSWPHCWRAFSWFLRTDQFAKYHFDVWFLFLPLSLSLCLSGAHDEPKDLIVQLWLHRRDAVRLLRPV